MTTHHLDRAHHHPTVRRTVLGRWTWTCTCGGASCRTSPSSAPWRQVVVEALLHSTSIAP
jgi:hypothetical protein